MNVARVALFTVCALFAVDLSAQLYPISAGNVTGCTGSIIDSGGEGGPGYSNNEDIVATVCPSTPGEAIFLDLMSLDLDLSGPAPLDQLVIHDGADLSAPVLATFSGNAGQGQTVAASPDNASGCLTLHFTSNNTGTSTFALALSCGTSCWPPTPVAIVAGEGDPALACLGDPVILDATGSTAYPGRTIAAYIWELSDGGTEVGAQVEYEFEEPGEYTATLTLMDDVGCLNTQQVELTVRVATEPIFDGTTESSTVCEGATVVLDGVAAPVTWTGLPVIDLGGGIALPDNVGQPFSSTVDFSIFPNGTTLTDVNDLLSVCVQMEHSYMGDLVIRLECPNGQNVLLHDQGGGGTFLGAANDEDAVVAEGGECWNYCWTPNATLGTWEEEAAADYTTPTDQGDALTPGDFSSVEPMSDLLGCPLNGEWTLTITDMLAIDNGMICGWSLAFDPSLYPDLSEFTPVLGSTVDSIGWSGDGIATDPLDPTVATIEPTEPGTYAYAFTVIDNFGCSYDTTITITVTPAPVVDVTSLPGLCTAPAELLAEIVANPPVPEPCTYTLVLSDSFGDGWSGGATVTVTVNGAATSYTLDNGDSETFSLQIPFGGSISVAYTAGTTWNGENSFQFIDGAGVAVYSSPQGPLTSTVWNGTSTCAVVDPITYVWTPGSGVSANNIPNPVTTITSPTLFTVAIYPNGQPWCTTQDTITVRPPSVLENDSLIVDVPCNGGTGTITINTTGLGGPWDYQWADDQGTVVRTTIASEGDVLNATAGTYQVIVQEGTNGNGCSDTLTATITEPPPLVWSATPTDTTICLTGEALLEASATGGTAPITLVWGPGLVGNGPHAVSPADSTQYTVQANDANGCTTPTIGFLVGVLDPISFDTLVDFEWCSGVPFVLEAANTAGGDGEYHFDWTNSIADIAQVQDSLLDDATICVSVSDGCETPSMTSCVDITVLHTPVLEVSADTSFGCLPFEVNMVLRDTTGGAQVVWDFGDTDIAEGGSIVTHLYTMTGLFDLGATVTWPNGCVTDTLLLDAIRVIPVPAPDFTYTPTPLSIFEPHARFVELAGPNEVGYAWDFFEFGTSDEPTPEITFPNDIGRLYPVQLVAWNELGCADTVLREILVEDVLLIHVPNAFSPNGDGINEAFGVVGNDLSEDEFQLDIFDRWGKVVFSASDPAATWNGTFQNAGEPVELGVYNWRIKGRSVQTLQKRELFGHVTLIR